ncbi:MAG: hypothetical protein ABFC89_00105 [Methanospirillum sp.]
MDPERVVGAIVGAGLALLGGLWFLQGTGRVRICPVLCFADCECVEGGSRSWAVAGAVTFAAGAIVAWTSLRRGTG